MDDNLISKRELLEVTGISYGALYRYKRKGLIPDDWFIRKSTFTGQETFFPREKILARMEQILSLKEDASLDDIADMLSPETAQNMTIDRELMLEKLSPPIRSLAARYNTEPVVSLIPLLAVSTADAALKTGLASLPECEQILQLLLSFHVPQKGERLLCYRVSGVFFCIVSSGAVWAGAEQRLVLEFDLEERVSALKLFIK